MALAANSAPPPGPLARARAFASSLAGRLLGLMILAVLAGELIIFAPALAGFHENWLRERMNLSQVAALALEDTPEVELGSELAFELLNNAGVQRAALEREGERVLLLEAPDAPEPEELTIYDYTSARGLQPMAWAFESLFAPPGRTLLVRARPRIEAGDYIEIILDEAPLKRALGVFAWRFARVSMLILMAFGALMYIALTAALVRPMQELSVALERFRDKPLDFDAGSKFAYSNSGYVLLGHILEKASGMNHISLACMRV